MADLDRGRVLRLKSTIESQLVVGSGAMSGEALNAAASVMRAQIAAMLPDDLRHEFEGDFPALSPVTTADLLDLGRIAKSAEVQLRGMSGWLQGLSDSLER